MRGFLELQEVYWTRTGFVTSSRSRYKADLPRRGHRMSEVRGALATVLAILTALQPSLALAQRAPGAPPPTTPAPPPEPSPGLSPEGRSILEGAVDAKTYVVGPGDRLLVEEWGIRQQSVEIEVNAEG